MTQEEEMFEEVMNIVLDNRTDLSQKVRRLEKFRGEYESVDRHIDNFERILSQEMEPHYLVVVEGARYLVPESLTTGITKALMGLSFNHNDLQEQHYLFTILPKYIHDQDTLDQIADEMCKYRLWGRR